MPTLPKNTGLVLAIAATGTWLIAGGIYIYLGWPPDGMTPNELGDWGAGTLGGPAIIWIVYGFFLQRRDLEIQQKALNAQLKEMRDSQALFIRNSRPAIIAIHPIELVNRFDGIATFENVGPDLSFVDFRYGGKPVTFRGPSDDDSGCPRGAVFSGELPGVQSDRSLKSIEIRVWAENGLSNQYHIAIDSEFRMRIKRVIALDG